MRRPPAPPPPRRRSRTPLFRQLEGVLQAHERDRRTRRGSLQARKRTMRFTVIFLRSSLNISGVFLHFLIRGHLGGDSSSAEQIRLGNDCSFWRGVGQRARGLCFLGSEQLKTLFRLTVGLRLRLLPFLFARAESSFKKNMEILNIQDVFLSFRFGIRLQLECLLPSIVSMRFVNGKGSRKGVGARQWRKGKGETWKNVVKGRAGKKSKERERMDGSWNTARAHTHTHTGMEGSSLENNHLKRVIKSQAEPLPGAFRRDRAKK